MATTRSDQGYRRLGYRRLGYLAGVTSALLLASVTAAPAVSSRAAASDAIGTSPENARPGQADEGRASRPLIRRVTVSSRGAQANGDTLRVFVANGGKVAAFTSSASNLVPGDVNHAEDVFLRRVTNGVTTRITLTPNGHRITRGADATDLTPDGRYVLLDVNGRPMDIRPMVLNRSTNRASWVTSSIPIGARGGGSLAISDDGRIVLNRFEYDLFIVNRARHEVRGGPEARFWASLAVLSGDGRWMAYPSTEVRRAQVYVRDRFAGRRTLVSRGRTGQPARGNSIFPSLSKHGRFVAFSSTAANLARGDTNGASDVFVRDRARHLTFMLTRGGGPGVRRKGSFDPDISASGRYVAFTSASGNLVRKDSNGLPDVFVRDRRSGTTCLISVGMDGRSAGGVSRAPEISADGRFVAFLSGAPNLVAGDTNRHVDGFVARVPANC